MMNHSDSPSFVAPGPCSAVPEVAAEADLDVQLLAVGPRGEAEHGVRARSERHHALGGRAPERRHLPEDTPSIALPRFG